MTTTERKPNAYLQRIAVAHAVHHKDNRDKSHHHDDGQDHLAGHDIHLVQFADLAGTVDILAAATGRAAHPDCRTGVHIGSFVALALVRRHVTILRSRTVILVIAICVAGVLCIIW